MIKKFFEGKIQKILSGIRFRKTRMCEEGFKAYILDSKIAFLPSRTFVRNWNKA